MNLASRTLVTSFAALALSVVSASADAHGRRGDYWGPGPFVEPPPVYYYTEPQPVPAPRQPAAMPAPDPIFYPRNAQSEAQTEADRVDCNRWATTQPSAMRDASAFQRATLACMEGRGYVVR